MISIWPPVIWLMSAPMAVVAGFGRVQKSIAVDSSKAGKTGVLEARNRAENFNLRAVFQLGLETDHIVERAPRIILTKLHNRIGLSRAGMRIGETKWFHWAMSKSLLATPP